MLMYEIMKDKQTAACMVTHKLTENNGNYNNNSNKQQQKLQCHDYHCVILCMRAPFVCVAAAALLSNFRNDTMVLIVAIDWNRMLRMPFLKTHWHPGGAGSTDKKAEWWICCLIWFLIKQQTEKMWNSSVDREKFSVLKILFCSLTLY